MRAIVVVLCLWALTAQAERKGGAPPNRPKPSVPPAAPPQSIDDRISGIVADHKDVDWGMGLVVGVVAPSLPNGSLRYFGVTSPGGKPPNDHSLFRLESVTKTLTATLLSYWSYQGCVHVNNPCALSETIPGRPLPVAKPDTTLQEMIGRFRTGQAKEVTLKLPSPRDEITLPQLSAHTSGLPHNVTHPVKFHDPASFWPLIEETYKTGAEATSTENQLLQKGVCPSPEPKACAALESKTGALRTCCPGKITSDKGQCGLKQTDVSCFAPGDVYIYSKWGTSLLGYVLTACEKTPTSWIAMLRNRVLTPLGMNDTIIEGESRTGFAKVECFDHVGDKSKHEWKVVPTLRPNTGDPAGGLWSTGPDMMKWLQRVVGVSVVPAGAMVTKSTQSELTVLYATRGMEQCDKFGGAAKPNQGLAWESDPITPFGSTKATKMLWKDGDQNSFHSFIGWLPDYHMGVFVLSNSYHDGKPKAVGEELLRMLASAH